MRKTLTLISLGLSGWILAGCDQTQDGLEPVDDFGAPPPAGEPDLQIGQGDPFETPEPASPGSIDRELEPPLRDDPANFDPVEDPFGSPPEPIIPPPQN